MVTPLRMPDSMLTTLRLQGFNNFRDATLALGPLTLLVGTNATGKSNVRDAFRFLHGIARGYTLADIIGEKWGEGGVLQWRGIRGGTREVAFERGTDCSLYVDYIGLYPKEILDQRPLSDRSIGASGSYHALSRP